MINHDPLVEGESYKTEIEKLRIEIDAIDRELVLQLSKRLDVVRRVGLLKKRHGIQALDKSRWQKVLAKISVAAKKQGVPENLLRSIYELIHEAALKIEDEK